MLTHKTLIYCSQATFFVAATLFECVLVAAEPAQIITELTKQMASWNERLRGRSAHFDCQYQRLATSIKDLNEDFFERPSQSVPNSKVIVDCKLHICNHDAWNFVLSKESDGREYNSVFYESRTISIMKPADKSTKTFRIYLPPVSTNEKYEAIWGSDASPFYTAIGIHGVKGVVSKSIWENLTFRVTGDRNGTMTLSAETTDFKMELDCRKIGDRYALTRHEMEGFVNYENVSLPTANRLIEQRTCIFRYSDKEAGLSFPLPIETVSQTHSAMNTPSAEVHLSIAKLTAISEKVEEWRGLKRLFSDVPNGNDVNVDGYKGIAFEWQDGEIVRRIDGKKLSVLEGHERERSPLRSILYAICLVMAAAVVVRFVMLRTRKAS